MNQIREDLLNWYDAHKRDLPWRETPSQPYHVMLSEFMLQQTTVTAVKPYYLKFLKLWPDLPALAMANEDAIMAEWAGLGYYSRARNLHRAAAAIDQLGAFPQTPEALKKLPGIGDYTANAIAAIAFNQPVVPIDGNVKRILARFHGINSPINQQNSALVKVSQAWVGIERPGDLAQAFMDLGSQICRPKNPDCAQCPLAQGCFALAHQATSELPVRAKKPIKKQWVGNAYIIDTPSGIAFEKRGKGLLGNMLGLPSQMGEDAAFEPPFEGNWKRVGSLTHIFTHIQLVLDIWYIQLDEAPKSNIWSFLNADQSAKTATLWRKALKISEEGQHVEG